MQSRRSGFAITRGPQARAPRLPGVGKLGWQTARVSRAGVVIVGLLASFADWGQSIQSVPLQNSPTQNTPAQNAPSQSPNGGDFSTNTHPGAEGIVPKDTILVKGAWSSASDSTTPLPESAVLANNVFTDQYFGIAYPLLSGWIEKFTPPPPSETGSYTLAQLARSGSYTFGQGSQEESRGSITFTAQDMFFTPVPAANAQQYVNFAKSHLPEYYELEMKPTQTTIAGQPFTFFAYWSSAAELHWYVLATQIRCHTVEIVLMNHDPKALEELLRDLDKKMKLPAEASSTGGTGGGSVPVCIKDYAQANVTQKVDPVLTLRRYNAIPVRIIIDREGKVKHIHFLSAYPEQEKAITEALKQWKFKPYEKNGQRLEVETGIMFGRSSRPVAPQPSAVAD
jgi:hypothetical protein